MVLKYLLLIVMLVGCGKAANYTVNVSPKTSAPARTCNVVGDSWNYDPKLPVCSQGPHTF